VLNEEINQKIELEVIVFSEFDDESDIDHGLEDKNE